MVNISNIIKYFILLDIIINNFIQAQNYKEYPIKAEKKENSLDHLNIVYSDQYCKKIIPSLFSPILVLSQTYTGGVRKKENINYKIPIFTYNFSGALYYLEDSTFLNNFNAYFIKFNSDEKCYFGLSMSYPKDTTGLEQNEVLLSILEENKQINKKIFSFDKFFLNDNSIDTKLYIGDIHNHFSSNDGIIGTCKINEEDIFWGCSFNEMIINNITIPLKRIKDNKLYKIYLTTENYDLTLPRELVNEDYFINKILDNKCEYDLTYKYFKCVNFFDKKNYIPLKLISEDLNMTLELDKFNKYYSNKNENEEIIRINFDSLNNHIIFPLILFKQFHVQFDAEKKEINFYTTDTSLLQVREEKKETPKNEEDSSSGSGFPVFLVILIILLIIGIGIGIFYFFRLRKNKIEKDINRFTKFEDEEEDFKNMNENKVY